ncbi:MAG: hypothetical protein ACTS2F_27975 [Thainema sp.]
MNTSVDPVKGRKKQPFRPLIWLFHPVVLISLVAHGVFLLVPLSSSSESSTSSSGSSDIADDTTARSQFDTNSSSTPPADAASALLPTTATTSPEPQTGTYLASTANQTNNQNTPTFTPSTTSQPTNPKTAIAPTNPITPSTISPSSNPPTPSPSNSPLPQVTPSTTNQSSNLPSHSPTPPSQISALPADAPQALIDYVRSLQERYSYKPNTISDKLRLKAIATWQRELEAESAIALSDPSSSLELVQESVTMSYPLVACLSHEPNTATVGLALDSAGTLQTEPKLLQSTGYLGLNQRALELVEQLELPFELPLTETPTLYAIDVHVDYSAEDCIAAR